MYCPPLPPIGAVSRRVRRLLAVPFLSVLAVLPALLLAACGGAEPPAGTTPARRVLVVGWDGATFDLVDPLLERGRLPNLARLIAAGRTAVLESTRIPISSAAWVGAVTGRGPGDTGVYDFFERELESYELRVVDARSNLCAPLWRILSNRGHHVNVWGVPLTWPPEPVNGVLVAGMLAPPSEEWAWPPGLADELRADGLVPDVGMWTTRRSIDLEAILQQITLKERALVRLLAQEEWTFSMVVFKSLDVLSHQIYDGRPEGIVANLMVRLDGALGRILEAAGPGVDVLVVSDHGFAAYPYAFNVTAWLVERGYAVREGDAEPVPWGQGTYVDYQTAVERSRLASIDLGRTRVLATDTECEGNFGSLRLNVSGREPRGVVPAGEVEALLDELERELRAARAADRAVVLRTWRGAELYPGPQTAAVPDLIFETLPDHEVVASDHQPAFVRRERPLPDHTLDGILVAAGPSIAPSPERPTWSILDLAPIVLHLFDEPAYAEMTGRARPELLRGERPVRRIREADDPTGRPPDEAWTAPELSEEEQRRRIEALRELGYADEE